MLRHCVGNDKAKWASYLPMAGYAYDSAIHESAQASPFSLVYIQTPDDFPARPQSECENPVDLVETAAQRLALANVVTVCLGASCC